MALVNIALCCSKAEIGVPVVVGWWGGVVQNDFHDHSPPPTIAGSVRIVGSVWIVGESINMEKC